MGHGLSHGEPDEGETWLNSYQMQRSHGGKRRRVRATADQAADRPSCDGDRHWTSQDRVSVEKRLQLGTGIPRLLSRGADCLAVVRGQRAAEERAGIRSLLYRIPNLRALQVHDPQDTISLCHGLDAPIGGRMIRGVSSEPLKLG